MASNISTESKKFLEELDGHIAKLETQISKISLNIGDHEKQNTKNTQAIKNYAEKLCQRINKDAEILVHQEEKKVTDYKALIQKRTDDHHTHIKNLNHMKELAGKLHQVNSEVEEQKKLCKLREWAKDQAEISIDSNVFEETIFMPSSLSEWPVGENMVGMVALIVPECTFKNEFDVKMNVFDVNVSKSGTLLATGSNGGGAEYTVQGQIKGDITGPFGTNTLWSAVQTSSGATFVSDASQNKVYFKTTPSSSYTELAPGTFKQSRGLAVSRKDKVALVDYGNKAIYIFSDKGHLENSIDISKTGVACSNPWYITFTSTDDLVISDQGQHCLHIISQSGKLLNTIGVPGTSGNGPNQLNNPSSVDTDQAGNILCADMKNKRIQVFGRDGKYKTTLLTALNGVDNPYGLCVSKYMLVVGEHNGKKIKIFNYKI